MMNFLQPMSYCLAIIILLFVGFVGCRSISDGDRTQIFEAEIPVTILLTRADSLIEEIQSNPPSEKLGNWLLDATRACYSNKAQVGLLYAEKAHENALLMTHPFRYKESMLQEAESLYWLALIKKRMQPYGEGISDSWGDATISYSIFYDLQNTEELETSHEQARGLNLLGLIYFAQDSLQQAREHQQKALSLLRSFSEHDSNQTKLIGEIYQDLGNTYADQDTSIAQQYYHQSEILYLSSGNQPALGRLYLAIGSFFLNQNQFDLAKKYYHQGKDVGNMLQDLDLLAQAYYALSELNYWQCWEFSSQKLFEQKYFQESLGYAQDLLSLSSENRYLGHQLLAMNHHLRYYCLRDPENLDRALFHYDSAYVFAAREGEYKRMEELHAELIDLCGEPDKACFVQYATKFPRTQEHWYRRAIDTTIRAQTASIQKLRSFDRRMAVRNVNRMKQTILWIGGVSFLILLLIFSLLFQRAQQQKLRARIEALRAQINPHFVSNTINAIEGLVNRGDKKAASNYLADFAHLSRSILMDSRKGTHSLADEVDTLTKYLDLLQLRFGDKFSFEIVIDPQLINSPVILPAMVVQPFVENAFFHGINPKGGPGNISVFFSRESRFLMIEIEDDGIGRDQAAKIHRQSRILYEPQGMAITRERIACISQLKGTRVEIFDKKDSNGKAEGTRVLIRLPYVEKKNTSK